MRRGTLLLAVCGGALLGGGATVAPWAAPGNHYHVTPAGMAAGAGTDGAPWDLATALAGARGRIQPGDTVWVHGGRYAGAFETRLTGLPERHIVFRAWPGDRATIDGTLRTFGAWLTFWGFEILQSDPRRANTYGLEARTRGGRYVNLVIHDAGTMGISFWSEAEDAELAGCIVYNNGTHENLDHGVYVHNERGRKVLADNVFFNNLGYGIHLYAAGHNPPQRNVRIEGNIVFNNGTIATRYRAKGNVIVGGDVPMSGMEVLNNLLYYSGRDGDNLRLGYGNVPNGDALVRGNVIAGGRTALRRERWPGARVELNDLGAASRAGPTVFVRPNRHEPNRAFVAVINPRRAAAVKVSLAGLATPGQRYEFRNVQDPYGAPVAAGVYAGDSVSVSMAGVAPPALLGGGGGGGRTAPAAPRTSPEFDVFLVTVRPGAAVEASPPRSGRSR